MSSHTVCRLAYVYILYLKFRMHVRIQALGSREQCGVPKPPVDTQQTGN